jgi:hypothetical protein
MEVVNFEKLMINTLSGIKSIVDLEKARAEGLTIDCFEAVYREAFDYLDRKLGHGKPVSKVDLEHRFGIELIDGIHDVAYHAHTLAQAVYRENVKKVCYEFIEDEDDSFVAGDKLRREIGKLIRPVQYEASRPVSGENQVERPPQKWLIDDILPEGWLTCFYGQNDSAKSYMATYMAMCISERYNFLAMPTSKRNVLYLDFENMGEDSFWNRCIEIARGMRLPCLATNAEGKNAVILPDLVYQEYIRTNLEDVFADIAETVESRNIGLLIIDSWGFATMRQNSSFAEGYAKEAKEVISNIGLLSQLPCTVVVLDHLDKAKTDPRSGAYGSVYKQNSYRWAWWVQRSEVTEDPHTGNHCKFQRWENTKHNISYKRKDVFVQLQWQNGGAPLSSTIRRMRREDAPEDIGGSGGAEEAETDRLGPSERRCYFLLQQMKEATLTELTEAMELSKPATLGAVGKLQDRKLAGLRKQTSKKAQESGKGGKPENVYYLLDTSETESLEEDEEMIKDHATDL